MAKAAHITFRVSNEAAAAFERMSAALRALTVPTRDQLISRMRANGIVHPIYTYDAALTAKLPLHYACALLTKESGGGRNVWGHDPVRPPQQWGGTVTMLNYLRYRKLRKAGYGSQGCGGCQLTYFAFQDQADALGGCWKPRWSMAVGFALLRSLIERYGVEAGAAAYNGSGSAARAYGKDFVAQAARWKALLQG